MDFFFPQKCLLEKMNEVNEDVLPGPEKTGFGFAPLATAFWKHEDPYVNTGGKKTRFFWTAKSCQKDEVLGVQRNVSLWNERS